MIRADYDPKYFRKFLLIGLGCIAFGGWFLFDGLVTYPAEMERARVYWSENPEKKGTHRFESMDRNEWESVVRERKWPVEPPHNPEEMEHRIQSQYFYAIICMVIAIPCLLKWLLAKGSWVEADDRALKTNFGPAFSFADITEIDKSRWDKKGITRIHFESGGRKGTFAFDDFKFQREPMGLILRRIESTLSDDQITGGEREKPEVPSN